MENCETLIIGAGMAGLTAARYLAKQQPQHALIIVDKGRGVGGRVATRRIGESRLDHGAPCFRLDEPEVAEAWGLQGLPLFKAPTALDAKGWVPEAGINALPKTLAQGLPLALQQTIQSLERVAGQWRCTSQEGQSFRAHRLLITCPLWQTVALLQQAHPPWAETVSRLATEVAYEGQWTLLLKLGAGVTPPPGWTGYQVLPHPRIASLYQQESDQSGRLWVIQSSSLYSAAQLEASPESVAEELERDLRLLGFDLTGAIVQAHRWRYARVTRPLGRPFVQLEEAPGLFLAGDFCLGSTVMAAALSGLRWAQSADGSYSAH